MKYLRIAALALAAVGVFLGTAAALILYNQSKIVAAMLDAVQTRTGIEINPRSTRVLLENHLVVILDTPRVSSAGYELVKLRSMRVVINYHSILFSNGLPLHDLVLDHPEVVLPVLPEEPSAMTVPKPNAETVQGMLRGFDALSRLAWQIHTIDGSMRWDDGSAGADAIGVLALRHRRDPKVWRISLSATVSRAPFVGARVTGKMRFGERRNQSKNEVAGGRLWFWNAPLNGPLTAGVRGSGTAEGNIAFAVASDGSIEGSSKLAAKDVVLQGGRLNSPIKLGDFALKTDFAISGGRYSIGTLTLSSVGKPLLSAKTEIEAPYGPAPNLGIHLSDLRIDAARLRARVLALKDLPRQLVNAMEAVTSGTVMIGNASFSAALDEIRTAPLDAMQKNLQIAAQIDGAGFSLPQETNLPPVTALSVQVTYSRGRLQATQGSAQLGKTLIHDLSLRTDLSNGLGDAPYQTAFGADADLAELRVPILREINSLRIPNLERIRGLAGRISIEAQASGKLNRAKFEMPLAYVIKAEPDHSEIAVQGAPAPLMFTRGALTIEPGLYRIEKVALATTGGDANLNGEISTDTRRTMVRSLKVELHQMPAGPWLEQLFDPTDMDIQGPVGGEMTIDSDPAHPGDFVVDGKVTLTSGKILFGFLRAPIVAQGATVTMLKRRVILSMPGSTLEGQPLDFRLEVPDIGHPTIRIDARSQKMNLEVMKFIQLPWTPSGPPKFFEVPVYGHVDIREANLEKLPMKDVHADFNYTHGDWRVYNISVKSLKGLVGLEVVGRKPDHWLHMKGTAADMDAGALFMLSGKLERPPLVGRLFFSFDLWGDTGVRFFQTLGGTASITARQGTLNKFRLLSRLLDFIDVKNWLTANIPDPRQAGIPFDTLTMDFKGKEGTFYTDNLVLKGKVMDIGAQGSILLDNSYLDMQVAMFPFQTASWLIGNIPVIGPRIADSKIVAAYFQVRGPISDASVTPMPITTMWQLVARTLGLPINIIRPNTIK